VNITAIIQARLGSTRLPKKTLLDLAGQPMLVRVVSRVRRARTVGEVVVATTTRPEDAAIADLCASRGWSCFCGSTNDVLDRYYQAARKRGSDVVVRITSDCPLIEPTIVDRVVTAFLDHPGGVDYAANDYPLLTFPRGLDTEVFSFAALERAWQDDTNPAWREHVTPFLYRRPDLFKACSIVNDTNLSHLRWTVDTLEDLDFARRIYEHFGNDEFSWSEVLALLNRQPELTEINRHVRQKVV
jgi:spore coat polysaccharide biosynthesis protein SpsF